MSGAETLLRYERTLDCVHCGLCLPACPTYRLTGSEAASPRGRIHLMRAFAEARMREDPGSIPEIDGCLVCRACETVCPSGVKFGEMMEITRDLAETTAARRPWSRALKRWFFRRVLPRPGRLRLLAEGLRWYQKTGLRWVLREFGILQLLGRATARRDALLPRIPPPAARRDLPAVSPADGTVRARVGYLVGCVAHELLPDANRAAVRVLGRNGCEVHCPTSRPCCGALPLHFGDLAAARDRARDTIAAFGPDLDAVVVASAGCASAMKEYGRLLAEDPAWAVRARDFAQRVKDFSEYLEALPWTPPAGALRQRVAFDDPCHLIHAQGIAAAPRRLLAAVPGLELVPFPRAEECCGAAGLYTLTSPGRAIDLLRQKMEHVKQAAPDLLATANPGCQLHLTAGAREWAPGLTVLHLAEILERAYEAAP